MEVDFAKAYSSLLSCRTESCSVEMSHVAETIVVRASACFMQIADRKCTQHRLRRRRAQMAKSSRWANKFEGGSRKRKQSIRSGGKDAGKFISTPPGFYTPFGRAMSLVNGQLRAIKPVLLLNCQSILTSTVLCLDREPCVCTCVYTIGVCMYVYGYCVDIGFRLCSFCPARAACVASVHLDFESICFYEAISFN